MPNADLLVDCQNLLGEGVQWNAERARVFWTDIKRNTLWSARHDGTEVVALPLDGSLCAFAFDAQGGCLAAFADGLYQLDPDTGVRQLLRPYTVDGHPSVRMNDGGVDRQGRFIVGGIEEDSMKSVTPVWCVDGKDIEPIINGVGCANSISFSPDGTSMYFADTSARDIFVYDYDPVTGALGARRRFASLREDEGFPDGSTVDADGTLWNAQFGGGGVQSFDREGHRGTRIDCPVPNVTCCAIGGPDMTRMFITTARILMRPEDIAAAPAAGGLFYVDLKRPGLNPAKTRAPGHRIG